MNEFGGLGLVSFHVICWLQVKYSTRPASSLKPVTNKTNTNIKNSNLVITPLCTYTYALWKCQQAYCHHGLAKRNICLINLATVYYCLLKTKYDAGTYLIHKIWSDYRWRVYRVQYEAQQVYFMYVHTADVDIYIRTLMDMGAVSISGSTAFKHMMAALVHNTARDPWNSITFWIDTLQLLDNSVSVTVYFLPSRHVAA